jgi:hypothetical protein
VDYEPSHEELRAFVGSLLSDFDALIGEPGVIDQAIDEHQETWVLLYRASAGRTTS